MNGTTSIVLLTLILMIMLGCQQREKDHGSMKENFPESLSLTARNTLEVDRIDCPVFFDVQRLRNGSLGFDNQNVTVYCNGQEVASQANDFDNDNQYDQIVCVDDFGSGEEKKVTLRFSPERKLKKEYPKRTQAEISHKVGGRFVDNTYVGGDFKNVRFVRVPPEHTDHSTYFRYEGPGWESDRVGYRFYLDRRNAIDIFGKKTSKMVLHTVGLDGFDSYHEMADWGMDILHVGQSLGIGSIGMWHGDTVHMVSKTDSVTCRIVANGPVYSQIETTYFGWKVGSETYDLVSELSITAGSRLTGHTVRITGNPRNVCTGLVKHEDCEFLRYTGGSDSEWSWVGVYGKQSLAGDHLGTAVVYKKGDFLEFVEDDVSYILLLKPISGVVTYYFLAAWEQEPGGIQNVSEFHDYLNKTIMELNHPIAVSM